MPNLDSGFSARIGPGESGCPLGFVRLGSLLPFACRCGVCAKPLKPRLCSDSSLYSSILSAYIDITRDALTEHHIS